MRMNKSDLDPYYIADDNCITTGILSCLNRADALQKSFRELYVFLVTDGAVDITKVKPISFDPFGNGYYGVGEKVGNAFKDGMQLK